MRATGGGRFTAIAATLFVLASRTPAAPPAAGPRSGAPSPLVGPAAVALGVVFVGHARLHPISISNPSRRAITVASVVAPEVVRVEGLALPQTLPPGGTAWFAVRYAPAAPGRLSGALTLRDPVGGPLLFVPLAGRAAPLDGATAVTVVAYGARGDGVADDRGAFQAAADAARASGKVLLVPRPPGGRAYRLTGHVRIHGSIVGEPGGARPRLRMDGATGADTPGGASPHVILYRKGGPPGTSVTGLHLDGGRPLPPGTDVYGWPEHSHGIALHEVTDVWVEDNVIEDVQGDAILLGGEPGTSPCVDVRVVANVLHRPMRCAVFSGDTRGLRVWLNRLEKVVQYQSAIDFEPNLRGQATWDAEVAYNDFGETLRHDIGVITSTIATRIPDPGGGIHVHDNWAAPGRYAFHLDLSAPGTGWRSNRIDEPRAALPPGAPVARPASDRR